MDRAEEGDENVTFRLQIHDDTPVDNILSGMADPERSVLLINAPIHCSICEEESGIPRYALVFCPATIVDSAVEPLDVVGPILHAEERHLVSKKLLSLVHPFLAHNLAVQAIIRTPPSDLVLLDLVHAPPAAVDDLIHHMVDGRLHSGPDAVLKLVLLHAVSFSRKRPSSCEIPACPVCLHRIQPTRLGGMPPHDLCSPSCTTLACPRQALLEPWPAPSLCTTCHILAHHQERHFPCGRCDMQETLWVCLTCAFVGCGRYSNKHAEEHFLKTQHPFCLELSTRRIWDYANGEFCHRADLLQCPSVQSAALLAAPTVTPDYYAETWAQNMSSKTPQKATKIGEEYEALLQSALEDQALHYEGEITRLRASLTAKLLDEEKISAAEQQELDELRASIDCFRVEVDKMGRSLVELQSQEAGHRAASQRLLREQQVSQDLIDRLRDQCRRERDEGRQQVDELEQQISDLTANRKMRQQFSEDQQLLNAQIFGTSETPSKKGKKNRRNGRR